MSSASMAACFNYDTTKVKAEKKDSMDSGLAWHRPQSATSRVEEELMQKSARALATTTDPLEKLRLLCLSRGASGIMGLGRIFRRMDNDGSKQLNKEEFFTGIKDTGLDISDAYWKDKKGAVKRKASLIAAARRRTGGGLEDVPVLSAAEQRILAIMGGESFATGDVYLEINPFEEQEATEGAVSGNSPSILEQYEYRDEGGNVAVSTPIATTRERATAQAETTPRAEAAHLQSSGTVAEPQAQPVDLGPDDETDAEKLFAQFDTDNSGSISVDEFIRHIRPPMSDSRRTIVEQAFKKLDKTGDGVIALEDLRGVYSVTANPRYMSGEETADVIMNKFLATFETEGTVDGRVTLEEFMNYYSGISVSIDNDCFFDLMMRQAYKL